MKFLNSFQRITSKGVFIPEIDGLRFLAIVPVVLMHANTNYEREFGEKFGVNWDILHVILNQGGRGVWIFFAISGFVLSNAFAKHFIVKQQTFDELDLKAYFVRRLTRLEPPFIISMLLLYFFSSLVLIGNFSDLFPNLVASLLYVHQFVFGEWSPINPVTWSLEAEVQFYLIAPFLCWFLFTRKPSLRFLFTLVLLLVFPLIFLDETSIFVKNSHVSRSLPVYIHHFLVGILMALFYNSPFWTRIKEKSYTWDLVCICSLILCFSLDLSDKDIMNQYLLDASIFLIMISAFKGYIFNLFFSHRIVTVIGGMCYSIYLIHYAVIFGVMKIFARYTFDNALVDYGFHMALALSITLIFSFVFFKFFEQPFMDKMWPTKLYQFMERKKVGANKES